jgi:hypothetical protein
MQRPRSRRVGDDEERRQKGFLPDFSEAIKAARGPREGDTGESRNPFASTQHWPNGGLSSARGLLFHEARECGSDHSNARGA